ncbi:hypothetical protein K402DRAFT_243517 [Aulographum hederae CBS 113979]|uniref:CFEM domain-containing protein n=1 Tax=Aulographum hederae CBS 113979 TaxID=1176131 RepID=A0A6G1HA37_9PEZI|nr:hypothetical protein K402DRAFT_243517 [Aulographum hederae CBS 113979]
MLPVSWKRFYIIASSTASVSAQQASSILPLSLQNSLPPCAWSCLSDFLASQYPSSPCSESGDLTCLCSQYGTSGFTLGEGSFLCEKTSCGSLDSSVVASAYNICKARKGAVVPTHQTLTITTTSSPTPPTSTKTSTTPITTMTPAPITTTPSTSLLTATGTPSVPSSSATPTPTSEAASSTPPHKMETSQIAGIVVACLASLILAVGLAAFIASMRRRRMQKRRDMEIAMEKASFDHQRTDNSFDNYFRHGNGSRPGNGFEWTAVKHTGPVPPYEFSQTRNWPAYYPVRPEDVGLAISPETQRAVEPTTQRDPNAPSPLLPQVSQRSIRAVPTMTGSAPKPMVGPPILLPQNLKPVHAREPQAARPQSDATEFEEDSLPSLGGSSSSSNPVWPLPPSGSSRSNQQPQGESPRSAKSDRKSKLPSLRISIPSFPSPSNSLRSQQPQPHPTYLAYNPANYQNDNGPRVPSSVYSQATSIPRAKSTARSIPAAPLTSGSVNSQRPSPRLITIPPPPSSAPPATTVPKDVEPSYPYRPTYINPPATQQTAPNITLTRHTSYRSNASETSFETDDDDPTPPEDDAKRHQLRLSPVAEAPTPLSALGSNAVKYPKIPRQSNQSVPRSPPVAASPARSMARSPSGTPGMLSPTTIASQTPTASTSVSKERYNSGKAKSPSQRRPEARIPFQNSKRTT